MPTGWDIWEEAKPLRTSRGPELPKVTGLPGREGQAQLELPSHLPSGLPWGSCHLHADDSGNAPWPWRPASAPPHWIERSCSRQHSCISFIPCFLEPPKPSFLPSTRPFLSSFGVLVSCFPGHEPSPALPGQRRLALVISLPSTHYSFSQDRAIPQRFGGGSLSLLLSLWSQGRV